MRVKKTLVLFLVIFVIAILASLSFVYNRLKNITPPSLQILQNEDVSFPSPAFTDENSFQIEFNQHIYRVASHIVKHQKNLILVPNFEEKAKAADVIAKNNCGAAINGGFYTKSYQPLGLFMLRQDIIAPVRKNELTNGFFWTDSAGIAYIAKALPDDWSNIPFIFQTGPVIQSKGSPIRLSIINDEPARRSLIGVDENNRVVFLSIFDPDHPVEGPYLLDVPSIIKQIEKELNLLFVEVLNLDGGTASFFHSDNLTLEELTLVGSLICEK